MKDWQTDDYWVSGMPLKSLVTKDLCLVGIKPLVNLCLKIKYDVVK